MDVGVAAFVMDQHGAHTDFVGYAQILRAVLKHGGAIWINSCLIQDDVIRLLDLVLTELEKQLHFT